MWTSPQKASVSIRRNLSPLKKAVKVSSSASSVALQATTTFNKKTKTRPHIMIMAVQNAPCTLCCVQDCEKCLNFSISKQWCVYGRWEVATTPNLGLIATQCSIVTHLQHTHRHTYIHTYTHTHKQASKQASARSHAHTQTRTHFFHVIYTLWRHSLLA